MSEQANPSHVGIILDGNRRWAKQNGKQTLEGHQRGAEVFKQRSLELFESGISYVSAYVFSTENWQRADEEVGYLMKLVLKAVKTYLSEFNKANIRIVIIGKQEGLSAEVRQAVQTAEDQTKDNDGGTLALCFNYGGQEEIVSAARELVRQNVPAEEVTLDAFTSMLHHPEIPPVDLLIRTSGEQRTSGFMLFRAAYAELYFIDDFWPDITQKHMEQALSWYSNRHRRFGR